MILIKRRGCYLFRKRLTVFAECQLRLSRIIAEGKLHNVIPLIIKNCCIFLFLITAIYITEHSIWSICNKEGIRFIQEEDESLFIIANHLLPEVISLRVAFTGDGTVDTAGIKSFVELEAHHH